MISIRTFMVLWLVVCNAQMAQLGKESEKRSNLSAIQSPVKLIAGVWDNSLTVLHDDKHKMTGYVSALNANHSKWEVMTHLPSINIASHDENPIVNSIQLTNTSLIFTMHPSLVHVYDLSVHKFVDKYPYYHPKQS
eukprot:358277_1